VGGDGKPAKELSLKRGHFEIAMPKEFLQDYPKAITPNWNAFYRG
jgi:hypothetical protein